MGKIYASLHTHSMDLFDSHNDPEELCAKMKELGGKGLALTQHGVLTGIEPMRKTCEKYGLKFVPGIEAYYLRNDKKEHLILLSIDDIGYKAISMAATEANTKAGVAVMDDSILNRYFAAGAPGHGHVIATSACSGGILASVLRENEHIDNEIASLKKKQLKSGLSPDDKVYAYKRIKKNELEDAVEALKVKRDELQKLAKTPFKKRENLIAKLSGEAKAQAEKQLENDKAAVTRAGKDLEEVRKELKKTQAKLSAVNREVAGLQNQVDTFKSLETEIVKLDNRRSTDEQLYARTVAEAKRFRNIFGKDCFYIEIQNHGIDNEKLVYPQLVKIARELSIPLVATNDVHIVDNSAEELLRRQIIRSKRFGTDFEELQVGDDQLYLKTDEELKEALVEILPEDAADEGLANIKVIFDRCNVVFSKENHYPKFPLPEGKTTKEVFYDELRRGIKWRFPEGLTQEYKDRLKKEVNIIETMGYIDYHLIVKDFLEFGRILSRVPYDRLDEAPLDITELKAWTKANGWSGGFSIGPGRGSAVGSLVCYLLGITSLDPIKYNLLFERFLNPERVSMPDIDSDISNNARPYVIKYVQNKYGEGAVCSIITFSVEAPKGAIRAASKFYSLKKYHDPQKLLSLGDVIARRVPTEPGTAFNTKLGNGQTVYEALQEEFQDNNDATEILRWAKVTEGTLKAYGVHAAGVVISDNKNIKEYLPLRWNNKKEVWTTQCDMTTVEEKGLLKMDFLGLKTLDVITECLRTVKQRTGREIDVLTDIPMDDPVIYEEIFAKGNTNSVFQFESGEMKNMLRRFHPTCFDDLIILVSMFRPGPLQFIDGVIAVKHGKAPEYITPELEPILGKTYGAIVYQEQVMEIFQKLAGYTLGGADQVRRYMSKKKADKLAHEKSVFISGCGENGISSDKAEKLFEQMNEFAKYAFNKSHAAAYAANAYYTAWLKYYYPAEFIAAAMNWADIKKIPGLMKEAKMFGVNVLPPDINNSETGFSVTDNGIVFGLSSVKSVGAAANEIIAERANGAFTSLIDFFTRTNISTAATKALIAAGAMDAFCDNRTAMSVSVDEFKEQTKKLKDKKAFIASARSLCPVVDDVKSADEFEQLLHKLNLKKTDFPKLTSSERLEARIKNAELRVETLEVELAQIVLPMDIIETLAERMSGEKEYLGNYVTAHPLDDYSEPAAIGATPIEDITSATRKIQGVISSLEIKRRKADNAEMAFFELEDLSGSIRVSCFTKAYEQYKDLIDEGRVVVIFGNMKSEEDAGTTFFVKNVAEAKKKKRSFLMDVSSYAVFHLDREKAFKTRYETENGNVLRFYDHATGKIRVANYTVSDDVIRENSVIAV